MKQSKLNSIERETDQKSEKLSLAYQTKQQKLDLLNFQS